jgi:hypothetical protein
MSHEAPPCDLEVTPEMIRAAVKVIAEDYGICSEYVAEGLAKDAFEAMMRARSTQASISGAKSATRNL